MAAVTDSIGTTGRDFADITAWEASFGDHAGDDLTGEVFNDSVFDENVTFNDNTPDSIKLTVPLAERHDGTAGTGSRIVNTVGGNSLFFSSLTTPVTCEWMEVDKNNNFGRAIHSSGTATTIMTFNNNICHDAFLDSGSATQAGLQLSSYRNIAHNNIIYNIVTETSSSSVSIGMGGSTTRAVDVQNNTVFRIRNDNGSGSALGLRMSDSASQNYRNNIVLDVTGTTSGATDCYDITSFTNATVDHNMSSDTTAVGTGSLVSQTAADQFISTVDGSEDLHLKSGADAIDAGLDLGTTPTGVNFDINNRDRDAEGDIWDMGAHEFVAAVVDGGGGAKIILGIL